MIHKLRLLMSGIVLVLLAACSFLPAAAPTATPTSSEVSTVDEDGNTRIDLSAVRALPPASGKLSQTEVDALLYMREEEKLAHDVYLKLYEVWKLPIFRNIGESERTHTEAVRVLLERYGLPDPAAGQPEGKFTNPALQDLYNKLIEQGMRSLSDALKVGAAIEEIDILDLQERIAQTDKVDIITVYENLMKGSRNHLRSFVATLKSQTGEIYQPQYLSPSVYQKIISTPIERGGRGK